MRYASFLLLLISALCYAQQDSALIFGYEDSTQIKVEVILQDPLQDIYSRGYLGLGTIGSSNSNGNDLALAGSYIYENSANFNATISGAVSVQKLQESGMYNLEMIGHRSIWSQVSEVDMRMKLNQSVEDKTPYYAHYPFEVRQQIAIDGGIYFTGNSNDIIINNYRDTSSYMVSERQDYVGALLGASYARTRNVSIRVNEEQTAKFFTKFKAGIHTDLSISQGLGFTVSDSIGGRRLADQEDLKDVNLAPVGFGFDVSYELETSKPQWLLCFALRGRALPQITAERYSYETNVVDYNERYVYSPNLLLLPSISIGYMLR